MIQKKIDYVKIFYGSFRVKINIVAFLFQASHNCYSTTPVDDVLIEKIDNKGLITLNRPKALNALDLLMIRKITPVLKKWEADSSVKFVIIKGAGDKAFCAGGDIRAVADSGKGDRVVQRDFFKEEYVLNNAIGTLKFPWIAMIDGITMGGGVGLSVHGRYRVATERTMFAMPETGIGLFPDVGGGHFLPRLQGKLGIYLALTGFRLKGRDVQLAGVATHFVESSKIKDLEQELLKLQSLSEDGIDNLLQRYHNQCTFDKEKPFILQPHLEKIDSLFGATTLETIVENLRKDNSEWSKAQITTLEKMSPTSMKVTLRQLIEGKKKNLQEVLMMEYRLSQRFMLENDFYEGVRAVIIDKDQKPKWNPSTIESVTSDKIDWYFSRLPDNLELKL